MLNSTELKVKVAEAKGFTKFDGVVGIAYDAEYSARKGKDYYKVLESFSYYIEGKDGEKTWIVIPKGYRTDGATVPRIFWGIIPPWGKYGPAVIVHDYLCDGNPVLVNGKEYVMGRKEADQTLREAMRILKVPKYQRWSIYGGVRLYALATLDFS